MKTFKMLSIQIVENDEFINFPLIDGIIINQENSRGSWVLELFLERQYRSLFEKWSEEETLLEARVVISYPDNEPAGFIVTVEDMKNIGENEVSILLKGKLKRVRAKYAEQLLEQLLNDGFDGIELLEQFEKNMKERPRLNIDKQLYREQKKN
ncbi:YwpF family protein [Savagea faecisuis]|uniref:YwpF family protein n=1 Tax=Savagea faecisuis TaxID=1274803 RepID=A0ABW3GYS8_9BACL